MWARIKLLEKENFNFSKCRGEYGFLNNKKEPCMYLLASVDWCEYDPVPHHHVVSIGAQLDHGTYCVS